MISKKFWSQQAETLGKNILGKKLTKNSLEGIISEVEVYKGENDPASHAYKGKTKRNRPMFDEGGIIYVYLIYGIHYCFNISLGNQVGAILIRSIIPTKGIEKMKINRKTKDIKNLSNGPGKLTQALQIGKEYNGKSLYDKSNDIIIKDGTQDFDYTKTSRIGINKGKDKKLRFVITNIDPKYYS
ncbi:DNA-3-methyladenine glycosylase [Candidatus Absconditicoccus praedator]|uniref:DNA-3-methyladenine glycosylase n=1 Tax=Candidatus Absconditicoccus praedator TaxID=2735562 RepID=UPI001E36FB43|nr:DNA-3-methyladenine glycosylase [Candidatus Absconditicoccus praedator]UFX82910.1 DNA-3-methyladenine glycosylase [Candidatus Absconditicoccus praedator]